MLRLTSSQSTTILHEDDEITILNSAHTIPGKALISADALSRTPLTQVSQAEEQLSVDSDIYVTAILQNLPVTDKCLIEIQQAQEQDAM